MKTPNTGSFIFKARRALSRLKKDETPDSHPTQHAERGEELIDVKQLLAELSVEEANRLAEEYFQRVTDWNFHLSKPFGALEETPQLLINFAVIAQGLSLCKGMTVLEFGAGTGWASRFLTQLGCKVISADVSETALEIGRELYRRQPVFGPQPEPVFLKFDGHHLDLPDESVDRVMCLDAFHHVPNPAHILAELCRVLKDGGIAGFAEPGPEHSLSPQSQYEMRTFRVIENDIHIQEIWREAERAGFTDIKLAVFHVPPFHLGLREFEDFLKGGRTNQVWAEATSTFLQNQRNFFLYKGTPAVTDSRYRTGLMARIVIAPIQLIGKADEPTILHATVTNTSPSVWLARGAGMGAVQLGCHVYTRDGQLFRHSFHWEALTPAEGRPILPNETVEVEVTLPPLPAGSYVLEFDMVSYDVCWFAMNGSEIARVELDVV